MTRALIEFAGIPGSGKSTLARALCAHVRAQPGNGTVRLVLADDGGAFVRALRKAWVFVSRPRSAARHWAAALRAHRNPVSALRIAVNAQWVGGQHRPDRAVVISDQAVAQIGWALFFEAADDLADTQIAEYLSASYDRMPGDKFVVLVDAAADVVQARLRGRSSIGTRLDPAREGAVEAAGAAHARLRAVMQQLARSRSDLELIHVTGEGLPEDNVRHIWARVSGGKGHE